MNEIAVLSISSGVVVAAGGLTLLIEKLLKPEILFHSKAGAASVMVPLVSKYRTKETEIKIIGADGEYAYNKPSWLETIDLWMNEGNTISYLLINPSQNALSVFKKLKDKYPKRFYLDTVRTDKDLKDEKANELVRKYEKFHFALFENPRQMWIEGYHPRGVDIAYDCEYVPPRKAFTDQRFDRFTSNFIMIQNAIRADFPS